MLTFDLPKELIAQTPAQPRDSARLLVYDRATKQIQDAVFCDIAKYLTPHTTLVLNNSKVDKCRLKFGNIEVFVTETINPTTVRALVRPGKKFPRNQVVDLSPGVSATVLEIHDDGQRTLQLSIPIDSSKYDAYRHTPFPPYIASDESLASEYQTVFAKDPGSKAAPTAGLHFTSELLEKVAVEHPIVEITLSVSLGTFATLRDENLATNTLHNEHYRISSKAAEMLNAAKSITAVGTTSVRTLEGYLQHHDDFSEVSESTNIFIRPGFNFKAVNSLVTNFHLPGTSLLYLVAAFIGSEAELQRIYAHAIKQKYRFYSFGDAMLIL